MDHHLWLTYVFSKHTFPKSPLEFHWLNVNNDFFFNFKVTIIGRGKRKTIDVY